MEVVSPVLKCLKQIFELRQAIRRQRRVNEQTYLRLTEIYVEIQVLQYDEAFASNATLYRARTFQKFELAALNFLHYLQKYKKMNRVVRLFKINEMEEARLQIVNDIDNLFQTLGLATCATVIQGTASAARNAAKFLSELEKMHSDIELTHDLVQAAILPLVEKRAERRKSQSMAREVPYAATKSTSDAQERVSVQPNDIAEEKASLIPDSADGGEVSVVQEPALANTYPTDNNEPKDEKISPLSVPDLLNCLDDDQVSSEDKQAALLFLIRKCADGSKRVEIFKAGGIPILSRLVRENHEHYFVQLYALHCLSWFTFVYSKLRESEFEGLRGLVRDATRHEMMELVSYLQLDNDEEKEIAALTCSCMATRGEIDTLRIVGVLPRLVGLLSDGTDNQKLWAAEALASLASNNDENCGQIAREGAIPPLVMLLRYGSDMHKQEAAYALGILAADRDENRSKIAREGAIPPMVAFVKAVTTAQNQWAVYALGCLCLNNEANRTAIAAEDAIPPLVDFLRVGTKAQKQWAAYTLGHLALDDVNRVKITLEGAINLLAASLSSGTEAQKRWASFTLGNLACSDDETDAIAQLKAAIKPLVYLVATGSDQQKQSAAYSLGNLASSSQDLCIQIGQVGAIAPLVAMLITGTADQKACAAYTLGYLAVSNDANRSAILDEGAAEPLEVLLQVGTDEQKLHAGHALHHLEGESNGDSGFLGDQLVSSVMKFFQDGVSAQQVTAEVAHSAFQNVRDGVRPLFMHCVQEADSRIL